MFTGIIEATAGVLQSGKGILVIERPNTFDDIRIGSSIAVSGVCLSVIELNKKCIQFDVVPETLNRTTIASYKEGYMVNLERAMKADARLDGHIVQGHVEATAEVVAIENGPFGSAQGKMENDVLVTLRMPQNLLPFVVPKGSIALDGVSLTLASIEEDHITVALIPHTLAHTTLGALKTGDRVNVETDVLTRHAAKTT